MFALNPARNFQASRPTVILSAADRILPLPEIGPLRFPPSGESHRPPRKGYPQDALFAARKFELSPVNKVPPRSRRISLRSRGGSRAPIATSRSNRIRTQTNRELNGFKMSTSQIHDFKSRKMSTSKKTPGGGYNSRGAEVPSGTTQISPGRKPWGACVLPISEAPQGATQGCAASRATRWGNPGAPQ
jgi:hypothetical protein